MGGVIMAISGATTTMTPNQTKSYPWATTIGAKSGTKIKMIAIESITHPKTKKTKRMQQINAMPSSPVDCTK